MTNVGIPESEQDAVFQLVATVLHLGNLNFTEAGEHDSSKVIDAAATSLEAAARLLGVPPDSLARALTTRTRQTVDGQSENLPITLTINTYPCATTVNLDMNAKCNAASFRGSWQTLHRAANVEFSHIRLLVGQQTL